MAILNLMPTKIVTETQLLRLLGNTPLQVEVTLLHMESHDSKNTPAEHLLEHYSSFEEVRGEKFDGLVITGAPVEQMPFEDVDYWPELVRLMDWARTNVYSTFYVCWGAQAGLYHYYGVPKHALAEKMFGVFPHTRRACASSGWPAGSTTCSTPRTRATRRSGARTSSRCPSSCCSPSRRRRASTSSSPPTGGTSS